jgi:hypothetical protein
MRRTRCLVCLLASVLLVAATALPSTAQEIRPDLPPARTQFSNVDKATCGPGSSPETGLQGQVPKELRDAGFKGFRCNLELLSQYQGEGATYVGAWSGDCFYMSTASGPAASRPGVAVVDVSYPTDARYVASLETPGMLDTHEALKAANGLLAATQSPQTSVGRGGNWFDVYDVSQDCSTPILKASVSLGPLAAGHEGAFAPDGRTYYSTPLRSPDPFIGFIAIDTSEPERPSVITMWHLPVDNPAARLHGLGISHDGNLGYLIQLSLAPNADNGLMIVDLSQIQARVADPQVSVISTLYWRDGNAGQMAEEFFMDGRTYVVAVDEAGSGSFVADPGAGGVIAGAAGVYSGLANWPITCDGNPAFAYGRVIDVTDPQVPRVVSKLRLEAQDPANCPKIIGDARPGTQFGYSSHYCSVDNPANATAIACGYFESGIRVFDIRDPHGPREIAYYNPPANPANSLGFGVAQASGTAPAGMKGSRNNDPTADWASSPIRFYHRQVDDTWELWTQTHQNGVQILRFTNGVYPMQ